MTIATVPKATQGSRNPLWMTKEVQAYYLDMFESWARQLATEGLKGKDKVE